MKSGQGQEGGREGGREGGEGGRDKRCMRKRGGNVWRDIGI